MADGNDSLPRALARDLDVRLGHAAVVVGHDTSGVTVETEERSFRGDVAVVAVPGPITLQLGFEPALPGELVEAHRRLGYATGMRIAAQYAEGDLLREPLQSFWMFDTRPHWLVTQSAHQAGDSVVVTTIFGGEAEPVLESEEQILDSLDEKISLLAGRPLRRKWGLVKSWTRDEQTQVLVRVVVGDQRETLLPILATPLEGRIFFAGEHTDARIGPGGMEGAVRSGERAAAQVREALRA
jgi:monoamine oxidase